MAALRDSLDWVKSAALLTGVFLTEARQTKIA
jgi:hypothetical protein